MCTNDVNANQFEQLIDQIDDHIALEYRLTHKLAHAANDADFTAVSRKLHAAQSLLGDVRALLDEAKSALEDDAKEPADITAKLL